MDKITATEINDATTVNKISNTNININNNTNKIITMLIVATPTTVMLNGRVNPNAFPDQCKPTITTDSIHRDVSWSFKDDDDISFDLHVCSGQPNNNGPFVGPRQRRNSTGGMANNQQSTRNQRQQQQQQQQQQGERNNTTRNNGAARSTLKFVGDFDFEKSNAEFDKNAIEDEIKKSLSLKTSKGEGSDDHSTKSDEEKEKEKEKENQLTQTSSTQSEHHLVHQLQAINLDGYYDKQKSFFDRISCEANEKEKTYVTPVFARHSPCLLFFF